jgi:hypothetical protein
MTSLNSLPVIASVLFDSLELNLADIPFSWLSIGETGKAGTTFRGSIFAKSGFESINGDRAESSVLCAGGAAFDADPRSVRLPVWGREICCVGSEV